MGRMLRDVDLYMVYQKWYENSGAFRCFFRSTNFVSLKHYPDFELLDIPMREGNEHPIISDALEGHDLQNTLLILDLPDVQAVDAAYGLLRHRSIKPILTFNGILHDFGLVGTKEYISRLVLYGQQITYVQPKGYAFILDNNRFGEYSSEVLHKSFNNQYELTDEDLPSLEMLKELGYEKVVYIYKGAIKEDIDFYLSYLKGEDFPIYLAEL